MVRVLQGTFDLIGRCNSFMLVDYALDPGPKFGATVQLSFGGNQTSQSRLVLPAGSRKTFGSHRTEAQ
jgi:hypothetical protein